MVFDRTSARRRVSFIRSSPIIARAGFAAVAFV
jgi:hypothetical protein